MKKWLAALLAAVMLALPAAAAETGIQCIEVVGVPLNFPVYTVYDADGYATNYVKLRDVAWALQFTSCRFSVKFDGSTVVTTGAAYEVEGGEMTPLLGPVNARAYTAVLTVDGSGVHETAYLVRPEGSQSGHFYYKLRDLAEAIGFTAGWSQERGVYIETPEYAAAQQQ